MRNFQKIKTINDYEVLDAPEYVDHGIISEPNRPVNETLMLLRVMVKAKYGEFKIPKILKFLERPILEAQQYDINRTGIEESWCYVTVRHGVVTSKTDDDWHFDGSSFRTDIIPERNYVLVTSDPTEYKVGTLYIPERFDPIKHNLFTFAENQLSNEKVEKTLANRWYLLSPFCLHRRPKITHGRIRTFYRICFTDIEGRDINNTPNPLIATPFYGRDPVKTFRNNLINFK